MNFDFGKSDGDQQRRQQDRARVVGSPDHGRRSHGGEVLPPPQIRKNGRAGIEASANMASLDTADRGLIQLTRFLNTHLF